MMRATNSGIITRNTALVSSTGLDCCLRIHGVEVVKSGWSKRYASCESVIHSVVRSENFDEMRSRARNERRVA